MPDMTRQTLAPWRVVPLTLEQLFEWAYVESEEDDAGHPKHVLLYCPSVFEASSDSINMRSWKLDEEKDAPRAVQTLALHPNNATAAFDAQVEAMRGIRELVLWSLGVYTGKDHRLKSSAIKLEWWVFTQLASGHADVKCALQKSDRWYMAAKKIDHRWRVTHRIMTAYLDKEGHRILCSPMILNHGDFVDVSASVEVVRFRTGDHKETQVRFAMCEVLRLAMKNECEAIQTRSVNYGDKPLATIYAPSGLGLSESTVHFAEVAANASTQADNLSCHNENKDTEKGDAMMTDSEDSYEDTSDRGGEIGEFFG
ncbi:hypothetical protein BKA93DRAFT_821287 [Sparassis latifolia]